MGRPTGHRLINQVELFSEQLASEQQELVLERAAQCVRLANKAFGVDLPVPKIRFSVKGTAWGYYQRRGKKIEIRFNPLLFARYFQEGLQDTVPHEIAHYFVDAMYTGRPKPHGREWREVMHVFGIENPRATSDYDTTGLGVRKQQRIKYRCSCQTHEVSKTRHNRMLRGSKYQCISCHEELQLCLDEHTQDIVSKPAVVNNDQAQHGSRRQQRFKYRCACQTHEVTKTRHNRMLRGTKYQCVSCHADLELCLAESTDSMVTPPAAASNETTEIGAGERGKFQYSCACEIHEVGEKRHQRIMSGTLFQCRMCDQELKLYVEEDAQICS